jgi:hypothetical protein
VPLTTTLEARPWYAMGSHWKLGVSGSSGRITRPTLRAWWMEV